MKTKLIALVVCILAYASPSFSQSADHLSPTQVNAVIDPSWASEQGDDASVGVVYISDMDLFTISACTSQLPGEFIYTPTGWLNSMSYNAAEGADTERTILPMLHPPIVVCGIRTRGAGEFTANL